MLLCKVPPPPETEGDALRGELTEGKIPVFAGEIPRLKAFEHAAAGVPVSKLTDERAKRAWQSYRAIAKKTEKNGKP